jgi:L-fucose isomerase
VFKESDLTLARLTRSPAGYQMVIGLGRSLVFPVEEVTGAGARWPHAFVRLDVPPRALVRTLQANHLHAVAGDYREELLTLCRLLDVKPVMLGAGPDAEGWR